jgi:hypothetical protein
MIVINRDNFSVSTYKFYFWFILSNQFFRQIGIAYRYLYYIE